MLLTADEKKAQQAILFSICETATTFVEKVFQGETPTLQVAAMPKYADRKKEDESMQDDLELSDDGGSAKHSTLTLLGAKEDRFTNTGAQYTIMLQTLSIVAQYMKQTPVSGADSTSCTKREIFYKSVELFKKQTTSDRALDQWAHTFGVPRHVLAIGYSSRGMIFGNIVVESSTGDVVDCSCDRSSGVSVPNFSHNIHRIVASGHLDAVFVLEKECAFRRLLEDNFVEGVCGGRAVLVTGCGYPDIPTRYLLHEIAKRFPNAAIYGIADADPHGIEILSVYKFGSKTMSQHNDAMQVLRLKWIGVRPSHLAQLRLPPTGMIPLSNRDKNYAQRMLERRPFWNKIPAWKAEVDLMMETGFKTEIECLGLLSVDYLSNKFLPDMLQKRDWLP